LACVGVLVDTADVLSLLIYEWLLEHVPHHVLLHSCSAFTEYASWKKNILKFLLQDIACQKCHVEEQYTE